MEPLHCIYKFVIIHRSSLRTVETKPVSFHIIHDLLYETKMIGVTKLLKSHVKTKSFSMGYYKYNQKKYIISYRTTVEFNMEYTVNIRIVLLDYI